MKRFLKRIGIIVAVIVGIILVLFVIFCVTHPNETKQVPEGNATNHPSAPSSASQPETIDTVDRIVKETLGSDVIETRFVDGTYYILMKVNGVDSAFTIIASELNDALDGLSERINDSFSVDCVIFVVDDTTHDSLLYATRNGIDITSYMN